MPYLWRRLTPEQQQLILQYRKRLKRPWHRPPHFRPGKHLLSPHRCLLRTSAIHRPLAGTHGGVFRTAPGHPARIPRRVVRPAKPLSRARPVPGRSRQSERFSANSTAPPPSAGTARKTNAGAKSGTPSRTVPCGIRTTFGPLSTTSIIIRSNTAMWINGPTGRFPVRWISLLKWARTGLALWKQYPSWTMARAGTTERPPPTA